MIRIGGRLSNTDVRIDHANKALHDVRSEVIETDKWVEEVEQTVAGLRAEMEVSRQELRDELSFDKRKIIDLAHRIVKCDEQLEVLRNKPAPLIPDISPLRAELRLLRVVLDELTISHNEEMTALWRSLGSTAKQINDLERCVEEIKIPDLKPLYKWVYFLATFNLVLAGAWIISIYL